MSALTEIEAKLLGITPELATFVAILQEVNTLTGVGGSGAAVVLKILEASIEALKVNAAGVVTHAELMTQLSQAHVDLAADRASEDAALRARFPPPPPDPVPA
jgi:hypothetical protein